MTEAPVHHKHTVLRLSRCLSSARPLMPMPHDRLPVEEQVDHESAYQGRPVYQHRLPSGRDVVFVVQRSCGEDELSAAEVDRRGNAGVRAHHSRHCNAAHSQLPTVPSHPVKYEDIALYLGVDNMAAQSAVSRGSGSETHSIHHPT